MPTADRKGPTRTSPQVKPAASSSGGKAEETRRLFESQLVRISLRLPKTTTQVAEVAFEMPVREFMASVLASNGVVAGILNRQDETAEPATVQPTPRLRRAIASAEKIQRGRFENAADLFDALGKAAQG